MFCSNCGKQIPENTKFCNYCGAQQQLADSTDASTKGATQQKEAEAPILQSQKSPKKKANILIVLAVVLCAFLLGKFVIAPSLVSDPNSGGNTGSQGSQSQPSNNDNTSTDTNNPKYDAIFDDTYIVHFQSFFMMETESFALKQNDGIICCADYGYEDDVVKQWVETMYVPISEYTDAQKTEVENTMKAQFAAVDALNCCAVKYNMSANYFTITCTYSDVDQATSYNELYSAGVLQTNTFISMSATETGLLSQGFVKK